MFKFNLFEVKKLKNFKRSESNRYCMYLYTIGIYNNVIRNSSIVREDTNIVQHLFKN